VGVESTLRKCLKRFFSIVFYVCRMEKNDIRFINGMFRVANFIETYLIKSYNVIVMIIFVKYVNH